MDFEQYPDSHFRCLTRADVIEAARDVDIVAAVAEALMLHSAGQSVLPEEAYLGWTTPQGDSARLPAMPGALVQDGWPPLIGMKTINASIGNPGRGIPRTQGFTLPGVTARPCARRVDGTLGDVLAGRHPGRTQDTPRSTGHCLPVRGGHQRGAVPGTESTRLRHVPFTVKRDMLKRMHGTDEHIGVETLRQGTETVYQLPAGLRTEA
ncbi:hypothetical protein [Streptomyces sp. NPDC059970]|uniref:hypothetical protein n=1 Tax=Streptomyces sp. NPDC059970 TaxID=3347019 RepID=UPI00368DEFB1